MMIQAMQRLGSTPTDTAVLGDRLDTDILGGINASLTTLLVLSGVTSRADAQTDPIKADYIFEDIRELAAQLEAIHG
jgi:ribonucleotide monophosphatase NagD (HAD superfamily)